MTLTVGTQLGTFEITGQLGAGGMGEVWRATDTKLGRDVAIKTLPATLADDAERLARFEREAKLLAALNHAHIAAVYSLDETDGTLYIVMELVEGESLEQRLRSGPLPLEEALQCGLQIASALEAAHEKGVVHRDLKPANIMLTPEGVVKVLDFGLAKAFSGNPSEANPVQSPALSVAMTQAGLVLGTAGYMSPEQASGQATDQRADIWAFGVVMYEMLTGQPVFSGESVPHILADVLKTTPDWERLPPLHPRLELMLERCLEKKPRNRYAGIADVRVDIESALQDPEGTAASVSGDAGHPLETRRPRPLATAAAALAGAVIAILGAWMLWPTPPDPGQVVRFSIPLPEGQAFGNLAAAAIAVSADGARIAYVANGQIHLRNVGDPEAVPVQGATAEGLAIVSPVFSPDGQWLAFIQVFTTAGPFVIERIPISGGAAVPIYRAEDGSRFPYGLSWPETDTVLFTTPDGVVRLPANGGATEVLVPRMDGERFFSPQLLPGDDAVLFTRITANPGALGTVDFQNSQIVLQSIGADDRAVVWEGGSAASYLPTGHLIYAQGSVLFAIPFDPDARSISGGPVSMLQNLRRASPSITDTAQIALSDTGTLVSIPGRVAAEAGSQRIATTLVWVDRDGVEEPLPVRADDYTAARISPDGTKIALVIGGQLARGSVPSIWMYDLTTENLSLLTASPGGDDGPVWSPDSQRIFFRSMREGSFGVYTIDVETGETVLIRAASPPDFPGPMPWSISDDGQTLAVVNGTATTANLAVLPLPDGEFVDLIDADGFESEPAISPNGRWIAYMQNLGAPQRELNIRPYPDAMRTRIPLGPGGVPVFARDGSELFYSDFQNLLAVPIEYEPTLRVGQPQPLIEPSGYMLAGAGRAWDVDPGGERFLMIRDPGTPQPDGEGDPADLRIDVVLNWFEELNSRVPIE
jgi:Tol biopolymer transport system component